MFRIFWSDGADRTQGVSRHRTLALILIALVVQSPNRACIGQSADELTSPKLAALDAQIAAGNAEAVNEFVE